jgi:hypothetical protein
MAGYIKTFATMPEQEVQALLARVEQSLDDGKFLFCLPQFLVVGDKP